MPSSGYIQRITLPDGTEWEINAVKVNAHTVNADVPANAVFTDTTYSLVGERNTTGLVKNGSDVIDVTLYYPCPIVSGVPYYRREDVAIYDGDGNEISTTYWKKSDTIEYDYDSTDEALHLLNDFDGYGYSDLTEALTI